MALSQKYLNFFLRKCSRANGRKGSSEYGIYLIDRDKFEFQLAGSISNEYFTIKIVIITTGTAPKWLSQFQNSKIS